MRQTKLVLLFMAFALAAGAAAAQEESTSGLYARVEGGVSLPDELDQDLSYNPNVVFIVTPPSQQTVDAGSGYAVGAAIGFRYESGFRTEMEYRYQSSDIDEVKFSGGFDPNPANNPNAPIMPDASLTAHLLMSNVVYELHNSTSITPFIGGGVGAAWVTNWTGPGNAIECDLTYAYQGRAGIALELNTTTRIGAEYVYVRTGELTYGPQAFTPAGPIGPRIDEGKFAASTVLVNFEKSF